MRQSFAAVLKLCEKPGFFGFDAIGSVQWAIHARDRCAARTLDNLQKSKGEKQKYFRPSFQKTLPLIPSGRRISHSLFHRLLP
ncbi:MAG: hypothetical protein ABI180_06490 [Microcoleus sp.]